MPLCIMQHLMKELWQIQHLVSLRVSMEWTMDWYMKQSKLTWTCANTYRLHRIYNISKSIRGWHICTYKYMYMNAYICTQLVHYIYYSSQIFNLVHVFEVPRKVSMLDSMAEKEKIRLMYTIICICTQNSLNI